MISATDMRVRLQSSHLMHALCQSTFPRPTTRSAKYTLLLHFGHLGAVAPNDFAGNFIAGDEFVEEMPPAAPPAGPYGTVAGTPAPENAAGIATGEGTAVTVTVVEGGAGGVGAWFRRSSSASSSSLSKARDLAATAAALCPLGKTFPSPLPLPPPAAGGGDGGTSVPWEGGGGAERGGAFAAKVTGAMGTAPAGGFDGGDGDVVGNVIETGGGAAAGAGGGDVGFWVGAVEALSTRFSMFTAPPPAPNDSLAADDGTGAPAAIRSNFMARNFALGDLAA